MKTTPMTTLKDNLQYLKLDSILAGYEAEIADAARKNRTPKEVFERLISMEADARYERAIQRRLHDARLPDATEKNRKIESLTQELSFRTNSRAMRRPRRQRLQNVETARQKWCRPNRWPRRMIAHCNIAAGHLRWGWALIWIQWLFWPSAAPRFSDQARMQFFRPQSRTPFGRESPA